MTQQFAFVTHCRVATHHLGNADLEGYLGKNTTLNIEEICT